MVASSKGIEDASRGKHRFYHCPSSGKRHDSCWFVGLVDEDPRSPGLSLGQAHLSHP